MYYLRIAGANFPAAPESIEEALENKNEQVGLVTGDQINILKKPGLTKWTMELRLPREEWSWAYYEQPAGSPLESGFTEPEDYVELLRKVKDEQEHFQLMLVEDMAEDGTVENFTEEVTLEDATFKTEASEGDDIIASCTFKKWVDYVTRVKTTDNQPGGTTRTTLKPKKKSYKVQKGDTLKKISKKMYGTQKYASKIYKWNKKKIEAAAKKHGRKSSNKGKHLYKGTKLKLKKITVKK